MIAVTHLDFASEMAVPRQVAGIEWVIGRHTHTPVGNIKGAIASLPTQLLRKPQWQPKIG